MRDIAEVDGWLCGCGTYAESEGRTILNRLMPVEQVQRIARLAVDCDADIFLEGPGVCYYCSKVRTHALWTAAAEKFWKHH